MVDFFIFYSSVGLLFAFSLNVVLFAFNKPVLTFNETMACIVLWPAVIVSFANKYNKFKDTE